MTEVRRIRYLAPLRLHIDPQLLALFIEVAALQAQRLRRVRHVSSAAFQFG